jgi:hypothetical protein
MAIPNRLQKPREQGTFRGEVQDTGLPLSTAYLELGSGEWSTPSTRPTFHDPSDCLLSAVTAVE